MAYHATTLDEVHTLRDEVRGLRAWKRARLEQHDQMTAEIEQLKETIRAFGRGDIVPITDKDAEIERLTAALKDSYENELYSALHVGVTNGAGLWWHGGMADAEWFCREAGIDDDPKFTRAALAKRVPEIAAAMVAKIGAAEQETRE